MSLFYTHHNGMKRSACAIMVGGLMIIAQGTALAGPKGAVGDLYVTDSRNNRIVQIDSITGEIVGNFVDVGLDNPREARFGPNGNLFVTNFNSDTVTEHNGETGEFIRVFASLGLHKPGGLRFNSNRHLLVYNFINYFGDRFIREYDNDGTLIGTWAADLSGSNTPIDFGPDGNLYVSNVIADTIDQYAPDGTLLGTFASGGDLSFPTGHTFGGPRGNLFVAGLYSNSIVEFDGRTGTFVGPFTADVSSPEGIAFGPDGNLWVANYGSNDLREFDGTTGQRIRVVTGFNFPIGITVKPEPVFCLAMTVSKIVAGRKATWDVSGVTPGSDVSVVYGFQPGQGIVDGQFGYCATFGIQDININKIIGTKAADAFGNASFVQKIPGFTIGLTVLTQAAEQGTCPDECVSNLDTQVIQ